MSGISYFDIEDTNVFVNSIDSYDVEDEDDMMARNCDDCGGCSLCLSGRCSYKAFKKEIEEKVKCFLEYEGIKIKKGYIPIILERTGKVSLSYYLSRSYNLYCGEVNMGKEGFGFSRRLSPHRKTEITFLLQNMI